MKCLIIEDDVDTAAYIDSGLRAAGHTTHLCNNGLDGLHWARDASWDVILLDRLLPGQIDGLSIVARLRALNQQTPVLIVSALTSIDERVRGLRSGGDDYISKPFAFPELLARVEALRRRAQSVQATTRIVVADLELDLRTQRATRGGTAIPLQPREFRLLEYLMRNAGQIVTRTMLLESVWDVHFDPQTNVIDVQISRLRNKVDRGFHPSLIHTVRGVGYRLGAHA